MGEVYLARDTRLDRVVAIKILPSHLSDNPEARQRFDREARAISSLSHPNICTLYDVGQQEGVNYLVMEFLQGETLADRLMKGALPLEQVLKYGIEICEGLEKAHGSGVVHRDLKPGNIMLTKAGAKLMDFGLARAVSPEKPHSAGLTATLISPEGSQPLTALGAVVGTFQYMSPEQLEGKEADCRSDIFAFGAVLYETATGRRAFEGKTAASVIAAVLEREPPPITQLQPMSPSTLEHVIARALMKNPDERWQSASDVKGELKWITATGSQARPEGVSRRNRTVLVLAAACALLLAALTGTIFFTSRHSAPSIEVRASILSPQKTDFILMEDDGAGPVVISPDGTNIAFVARDAQGRSRIWVRASNGGEARALEGTDEGTYPFWSPDSKWLGFSRPRNSRKYPSNPAQSSSSQMRSAAAEEAGDPITRFCSLPLLLVRFTRCRRRAVHPSRLLRSIPQCIQLIGGRCGFRTASVSYI